MSEEFENLFLRIRPQWGHDKREDVFRKFTDASERLNGKYVIQEVQFAFEVWSASQAREAPVVAVVYEVYVCPRADGKYRATVISDERLSQGAELFISPTIKE